MFIRIKMNYEDVHVSVTGNMVPKDKHNVYSLRTTTTHVEVSSSVDTHSAVVRSALFVTSIGAFCNGIRLDVGLGLW